MKISKSKYPWHYELYEMGVGFTDQVEESRLNFCRYSRKVLVGVFAAFVMVLVGVLLSLLLIEPVMAIGLWTFTDNAFTSFFDPNGGGELIWIVDTVIFLFVLVGFMVAGITEGCNYTKRKIREWERSHLDSIIKEGEDEEYVPPEPGFFATLYTTVKDKVCVNMEITE